MTNPYRSVAVTGASGFIGRYVLEALKRRDVEITAVTRNADRLTSKDVHVVEMDLTHPGPGTLDRLGRPDVLIHLAWGGLPNYKSLTHFEIELPQQYRFLKALLSEGLSSLVVSGTCFEYGKQSGPLHEELHCCPNTPYGFAKDALRQKLEFLRHQSAFNLTWLRLFYVYGDGQGERSLWTQFRAAVTRGDRTFPMSHGDQLRDFLPVEELADSLVRIALSSTDAGIVNVCSGRPRSVRGLVEEWKGALGNHIELQLGYYPYLDYEPMAFWGTRQKLNKLMSINDEDPQLV